VVGVRAHEPLVVAWVVPLVDDTVVLVVAVPVEPVDEDATEVVLPARVVDPVDALVQVTSPTVPATDAATIAAVTVRALRFPTSRMFTISPRLDP
jgi:hypothetical protein